MTIPSGSYTISWREDEFGTNAVDDNIDVTVRFATGERYVATMFSVTNLQSLLRQYRVSGECANGLYVWAPHMIVLATLDRKSVEAAVKDLIETGEFVSAFDGPYIRSG